MKVGGGGTNSLLLTEEGSTQRAAHHTPSLPPIWVDDVDSIHAILSDIRRNVGVLNSLHANRLSSVFGKDLELKERDIETLTRDITTQFRSCERLLLKVGAATKNSTEEERRIGANVQRSLAKQLQELSADFRQKQRKYLKDVQIQKSGGSVTETKFGIDLEPSLTEDQEDYSANKQQRLAIVEDLQEAVQSRDCEISKIAESIEELSSIFKELAVLVIDHYFGSDRLQYGGCRRAYS